MKLIDTGLKDVVCFEPKVFGDERGYFMETWRTSWFENLGIKADFVQDNHSLSRKGILRGLHYQIKQPQGKLVRVTRGEVFDVAVDVRRQSPTFGRWVAMHLSAENKRIMWVPPGFAHGFLVLSDEAEFSYKCTDFYAPQFERSILWNDPDIGIEWPLKGIDDVVLSEKDRNGAFLKEAEVYEDAI